jgi:hypothetical protein
MKEVTPYLLSLPERVLRSASALAGGLVRELGDVSLPGAVRRTRLYKTMVETTLRFLIEQVGQVEGAFAGEGQLAENFIARRTAGNGIELVGILAFHASPVWVMAALADLSGAGRHLIREISETLKKEGLLEPETSFETMDELLDGLEKSAGRLAETINTPPLDVRQLRAEWDEIRREAPKIPAMSLPSVAILENTWRDLKSEAAAQGRTVFELSSLLAISAISGVPSRLRWFSRTAVRSASRAGELVAGTLLEHYRTTLAEIHKKGFLAYWRQEFRPYLLAAARNFSPGRISFTEKWLHRRSI